VHTRLTRGFKAFLYKGTDWHRCLGVQVSILTFSDANEALALAKIESALRLIAQYTPSHIGRIRALVRGILVLPIYSGSLAEWNSQLDACFIGLNWILERDGTPEAVASLLVHELTHARLDKAGFPYGDATRARIERICALAERNFVCRLPVSDARNAIEQRINWYLEAGADYWTDDAVKQRARETRQSWPLWRRAMYPFVRGVAWLVTARRAT
jgi:hypothetical protein